MTRAWQAAVSRRTFIKGVIAAGATVSASAYLFRTTILGQNESSLPGSVERLITLDVNGQQRRVDVLKHETLAMTLRYKLGLTGTKLGCDRGSAARAPCSSTMCRTTRARFSRTACAGKKVTTVEGLASPDGKLIRRAAGAWSTARASSAPSACRASSWRPPAF